MRGKNILDLAGFEVFTAVVMKSIIFWDMILFILDLVRISAGGMNWVSRRNTSTEKLM
jgi:hypothetical protein